MVTAGLHQNGPIDFVEECMNKVSLAANLIQDFTGKEKSKSDDSDRACR